MAVRAECYMVDALHGDDAACGRVPAEWAPYSAVWSHTAAECIQRHTEPYSPGTARSQGDPFGAPAYGVSAGSYGPLYGHHTLCGPLCARSMDPCTARFPESGRHRTSVVGAKAPPRALIQRAEPIQRAAPYRPYNAKRLNLAESFNIQRAHVRTLCESWLPYSIQPIQPFTHTATPLNR